MPQLAAAGMGEAFHFLAQLELHYQDFPETLKSTSTAGCSPCLLALCFISAMALLIYLKGGQIFLDHPLLIAKAYATYNPYLPKPKGVCHHQELPP